MSFAAVHLALRALKYRDITDRQKRVALHAASVHSALILEQWSGGARRSRPAAPT